MGLLVLFCLLLLFVFVYEFAFVVLVFVLGFDFGLVVLDDLAVIGVFLFICVALRTLGVCVYLALLFVISCLLFVG